MEFGLLMESNYTIRLTLSKRCDVPKNSGTSLTLPLTLVPDRWTVICIDLKETTKHFNLPNFVSLKTIQLYSTILVRAVFTSDNEYNPKVYIIIYK